MTEETLKKANELANKLEEYKHNLKKIGYTQSENVTARRSYLSFNGIESSVEVPKTLFRVIGKLVEAEYIKEINELQKELNDLQCCLFKTVPYICKAITQQTERKKIMPIELLHTDTEILKIRTQLLKKSLLNNEELSLLKEINDYCNRLAQ